MCEFLEGRGRGWGLGGVGRVGRGGVRWVGGLGWGGMGLGRTIGPTMNALVAKNIDI